jgi:predicted site-specific integrase-resolvase
MTQTAVLTREEWISVGAAMRIIGKSRSQFYRYIDAGKIKTRRCGTLGWIQVNREDVEKIKPRDVQNRTLLKENSPDSPSHS